MSFIGGSLLRRESVIAAELYLEFKDWDAVREKVISDNLLQARTINSAKRFCREVVTRLKELSDVEIELFVHAMPLEQGYILWMAICRHYRFVAEFAIELLRERYISLKASLTEDDFLSFFNRKSEWHAELEQLTTSTKNKVRQILFRILREAQLIEKDNTIKAALLSPKLLEAISINERKNALYFPIFDSELEAYR